MDRDTAVATIARRLGNRTDLDTDIVTEMQAAQTLLESDRSLTPWFLLTEMASASVTADEERLPVPVNFLREYEYGTLWIYDSTAEDPWIELGKGNLDDLIAYHKGGSGTPVCYALTGEYFRLFPTPDAAMTAKMIYYKQGAVLSTNIENVWLEYAPQLLIAETGMVMAAYLQNKIAHAMFKGLRDSERKRIMVENASRESANTELTMGGE